MNAKLKEEIDRRRDQINESFNSTFANPSLQLSRKDSMEPGEIPMFYLVLILGVTLLMGVVLGTLV